MTIGIQGKQCEVNLSVMEHFGISIIIPTRNNAKSLSNLFERFLDNNTYSPVEFIIVDNASTDQTPEMLSRFATRAFIRVIKRSLDSTPGALKNAGASKARFPYLLFMNDGINFSSDILATVLEKLKEPSIGAISVRLEDDPSSVPPGQFSINRHTGITFESLSDSDHLKPVYVRPSHKGDSKKILSGMFPAITGDFLLCRKSDFQMLSGFCENYSKGLEDIDFCLQLKTRLDLHCWCFNDLSLSILNKMNQNQGDLLNSDQSLLNERQWHFFNSIQSKLKPQNILFIHYGSIDCNSGYHVQHYAQQLCSSGFDCRVGVPVSDQHKFAYNMLNGRVRTFEEILDSGIGFNDGRGPDVIHAWTPREVVRLFCEQILKIYPCPVIVHLEDNEPFLTEAAVGRKFAELEKLPNKELDQLIPDSCFHPVKGRKFLAGAKGITVIIDTLSELNIKQVPSITLQAPVDDRLFYPRPLNLMLRKKLNISESDIVLVYNGNVHAANRDEVLELYKTVSLLNQQGQPATLIRTGINAVPLGNAEWITAHEKNLGWVRRTELPGILAAADILIQPGKPGPFNNQRIPSKLPEYFAIGRPVILPKTNIGLFVEPMEEAYVVKDACAEELANAVKTIAGDFRLKQKLSAGAASFYRTRLMNTKSDRLMNFYLETQPEPYHEKQLS